MERLDITERKKEMEVHHTAHTDFVGANARNMSPESLISESGWAPYSYNGTDFMFTRTPTADLAKSAFVYVTQYNDATEIATVSAAEVLELADRLPMPDVLMIYSMGRCGTTLANHVLNASDEIWCLSEPDVIDQAAVMGNSELVRAVAKLLFAGRSKPDARVLGVKLRSMSLFDADKFNAALPEAKNVFMYRDAVGWANSFYTLFFNFEDQVPYSAEGSAFSWEMLLREPFSQGLADFDDLAGDTVEPGALFAGLWQRHIEQYTTLKTSGMAMTPIRYNEFNADREAGVANLFSASGLKPISAEKTLAAFATDSQKGTFVAQVEKPRKMDDAQKDFLRTVLAKHGKYGDPDLILT